MVEEIEAKIMTKKRFSNLVEDKVKATRMSYIDAICKVCEDNVIDPLETNRLLVDHIVEKVEAEAMELNLLPRKNKLLGIE